MRLLELELLLLEEGEEEEEVVVALGGHLTPCAFHRVEVWSIYSSGEAPTPLYHTFKAPGGEEGEVEVLGEGEVEVAVSKEGRRVLRWADRCLEEYRVTYCRLPLRCR